VPTAAPTPTRAAAATAAAATAAAPAPAAAPVPTAIAAAASAATAVCCVVASFGAHEEFNTRQSLPLIITQRFQLFLHVYTTGSKVKLDVNVHLLELRKRQRFLAVFLAIKDIILVGERPCMRQAATL
jgi:hypothetical protein